MRVRAAVGAAAMAGMLTAGCSGAHPAPAHRAAAAATTATKAATPTTRRATPLSEGLREAQQAQAALSNGEPDGSNDGVLYGAAGQLDSSDMDRSESVPKGRRLVIEVACVGKGEVAVTVVSGRAAAHRTVPCGATAQVRSLELTTAAPRLDVERTAGPGANGGLAYVVRKAA